MRSKSGWRKISFGMRFEIGYGLTNMAETKWWPDGSDDNKTLNVTTCHIIDKKRLNCIIKKKKLYQHLSQTKRRIIIIEFLFSWIQQLRFLCLSKNYTTAAHNEHNPEDYAHWGHILNVIKTTKDICPRAMTKNIADTIYTIGHGCFFWLCVSHFRTFSSLGFSSCWWQKLGLLQ